MKPTNKIRTRLLILSDTHGKVPFDAAAKGGREASQHAFRKPLPKADVVIHCGDMSWSSAPAELEATFNMMRDIDAPLKIAIPGNHDFILDLIYWDKVLASQQKGLDPATLAKERQRPADCYAAVERARRDAGIHVLTVQGTYRYVLANGARLTVFASPWTPGFGSWGFQYQTDDDGNRHTFAIAPGGATDVVVTHGPPYSLLDEARRGVNAGCPALLAAVRRATPQLHCFGHIHEAAGAALVRWCGNEDVFKRYPGDNGDDEAGEAHRVSLCAEDTPQGAGGDRRADVDGINPGFELGKTTLFVNAAIMTVGYKPHQAPWLVDLELPLPDEEHRAQAAALERLSAVPRSVENERIRQDEFHRMQKEFACRLL